MEVMISLWGGIAVEAQRKGSPVHAAVRGLSEFSADSSTMERILELGKGRAAPARLMARFKLTSEELASVALFRLQARKALSLSDAEDAANMRILEQAPLTDSGAKRVD